MDANEDDRNRRLYFKNIRKKQKKRRKERRREEERKKKEEVSREKFHTLVQAIRGNVEAREEPAEEELFNAFEDIDVDKATNFPVGIKEKANCTATTAEAANALAIAQLKAVSKTTQSTRTLNENHGLKEIDGNNIKLIGKTIGSGSFGTCQLAHYRGMLVVVKQLRSDREDKHSIERRKRQVIQEATVISQLGDHAGLPLLFGIQTRKSPCSIVMQFHGTKDHSFNLWRAAHKKALLSSDEWNSVVDLIGKALLHVHSKGYLHNDLKANNVVLEKKDGRFNPVIIDFGKSLKVDSPRAKRKPVSKAEQKAYRERYPHIAPEIVSGTGTESYASDVYSFGKLVEFLFSKRVLSLGAQRVMIMNLARSENPDVRPQLVELIRR